MSFSCRPGCGACCIAPSISSPIPSVATHQAATPPAGKLADTRCPQLDAMARCRLFGDPRRPAVCGQLQASEEMCGDDRDAALRWLSALERATVPG